MSQRAWLHLTVRQWVGVALCAVLAACGGGGDAPPEAPVETVPPAIGAAGGAVSEASGASVLVPAGAFSTDTTVRIAKNSTGAPAMPTWLTPSGDMYMITPHGGNFRVPVQVSIPLPAVTLQPNQEFKLAKAQPGGEWEVLGNSRVENGKLVADVNSFSFVTVLYMSYPLPLDQKDPIRATSTLECVGQDCSHLMGPVTFNLSVAVAGTQFPSICAADRTPELEVKITAAGEETVDLYPLAPGVVTKTYGDLYGNAGSYQISISQYCYATSGFRVRLGDSHYFPVRPEVQYPGMRILQAPQQLDVIGGAAAAIEVVMDGGTASTRGNGGTYAVPTATNRATIDWQRSDDRGASWRTVATSFQNEANPWPTWTASSFHFDAAWRAWSVKYGFVATDADHGALIRPYACYTPPDVPAPPCVTGASTRINVLQQSAVSTITQAPYSVLVRTGQTASFSATASGTPAPTLQWQTRPANSNGGWTDVASGTGGASGNYTTGVLAPSDNGMQLRVVATNAVSSVGSNSVTVSVSDVDVPPSITTQPANLSVTTGNDAAFAIAALGTEALSYQWQYNGVPISGANSSVLRLAAVGVPQAGSYSVLVSNAAGSVTSQAATLSVGSGTPAAAAPSIVTQPVSATVNAGNTATLAVGVSGTGPFSYQWLLNGTSVAGATAAFYSIPAASASDAGTYMVEVNNAAGSVTSGSAALTVIAAAQPVAVTVTTHPSPQVQAPGGRATFAIAASGSGPISYQWLKDGAAIPGASSPVLNLGNLSGADMGSYAVTLTNAVGTVTSNAASLTVLGAPAITAQPAAATANEGASATFSVQASGTGLMYQWTRNQVAIAGATSASYTTPALVLSESGDVYAVVVYNGAGVAISQGAALTVNVAPITVAAPLAAGKIAVGQFHTCAVKADSTVACWGHNTSHEVAPGPALTSVPEPVVVAGLTGITHVAAGYQRSCAIGSLGSIWCWGGAMTTPTLLKDRNGVDIAGAKALAMGYVHNCFIDATTAVQCWGDNSGNQLGQGAATVYTSPVVVQTAAGPLTDVVGLAAGDFHTCALKFNGDVVCWGQGPIGDGTESAARAVAIAVTGATAIGSGAGHVCAAMAAGGVKCWGANDKGQLGNMGTTSQLLPVNVADLPGFLSGVTVIAAESKNTCAVPASGRVVCWGAVFPDAVNGTVTYNPTEKGNLSLPVVAMASNWNHSCALVSDGSMECWGSDAYGQLGNGISLVPASGGGPLPPDTSVVGGAIFWH